MSLSALCLSVWLALGFGRSPDAPLIAAAIEASVEADPSPVWGREYEAAVMAYYAVLESGVRVRAHAHDPFAWGTWQIRGEVGKRSPREQARAWLYLLHEGARICPDHPLAPLSGGCAEAWRLGDRRMRAAFALTDGAIYRSLTEARP